MTICDWILEDRYKYMLINCPVTDEKMDYRRCVAKDKKRRCFNLDCPLATIRMMVRRKDSRIPRCLLCGQPELER